MKLYYTMTILLQLLFAFFSRDKNKTAYMLYLLRSLLDNEKQTTKHNNSSSAVFKFHETKPEVNNNEYSLLLER